MPGRLLVVDDLPETRALVSRKLSEAYFDIVEAASGEEALRIAGSQEIDLVVLDILLPGIDGFETCRRLRRNPDTQHIPVVMLSELLQNAQKIEGLESGADDVVSKPCDYAALVTRIKSLTRMKMVMDELRLRHACHPCLPPAPGRVEYTDASILLICPEEAGRIGIRAALTPHLDAIFEEAADAGMLEHRLRHGNYDAFVIWGLEEGMDAIHIASQLRARPETRHAALMLVFGDEELDHAHMALDMGIADYVTDPPDFEELAARLKVQLRRKFYSDQLRISVESSMTLAVTDPLTGLMNRRHVNDRLQAMQDRYSPEGRGIAAMILDLDHFKEVNDTWGHPAGDAVLKEFARRLSHSLRGADLVARLGGEEFLVIMPGIPPQDVQKVAERLRNAIQRDDFALCCSQSIEVTVSIGVAIHNRGEAVSDLLVRADRALYSAKHAGRNTVTLSAA
ncbi:MAG: diguanylate cyclase [Pseudomonadota bacterium]